MKEENHYVIMQVQHLRFRRKKRTRRGREGKKEEVGGEMGAFIIATEQTTTRTKIKMRRAPFPVFVCCFFFF